MKKELLNAVFDGISQINALIIGDVMLDSYTLGEVNRISPEAPVPVINVTSRYNRLGGASNVALNIKSLGAKPVMCSVIGNDKQSLDFIQLMKDEGLPTDGILLSNERILTVKHRIIGNKMQLLRIDEEVIHPLSSVEESDFLKLIKQIIAAHSIDVIIFEDYDKGIITENIIEQVIDFAQQNNIPITVDPKKRNFLKYNKTDIFKPNLKELKEGCEIGETEIDDCLLKESIKKIMIEKKHKRLLLTLSANGALMCEKRGMDFIFEHIPAHLRNIADVSGAGDTVISVASLCLVLSMDSKEIATFANLAGGLVCEEMGVVAINKEKYANEIIKCL